MDPYNLLYILGGWTYAGFEIPQNNVQFEMHGGIVGAGFERRISPLWGMKVEYRYTKFQSRTIDLPSSNTSNSSSISPAAPPASGSSSFTQTSTSFSNTAAHFDADMHTVFVGVARYFDTY
jgi:opacity protein-like surface antigen